MLITKDVQAIDLAFILSSITLSAVKVLVGILCKLYNLLWMYSIRKNLVRLLTIVFAFDLVILAVSYIPQVAEYTGFLASIYISIMLLEFFYLVSSRFAMSIYFNMFYKKKGEAEAQYRTLIVGAGNAGAMVLNEIGRKEYGYQIVAFIDDSKDKIGTIINNVKVYGPIENINEIVKKLHIEKIIIAIPSSGMARMKEVANIIDYKNVAVEILPDKSKLLQSNLHANLRKVEIADLLGRSPIELDKTELNSFISGKTILVTGGGGSIGSEIARQVLEYHPKQLVIFDIYENTTYELKTELDMKYHKSEVKPNYLALIGSVRDPNR